MGGRQYHHVRTRSRHGLHGPDLGSYDGHSNRKDPMTTYQTDTSYQPDVDSGRNAPRRGNRTFTETKAGFKTTELMLAIVAIAAILIATYVVDADLGANEGWRYATWVAVAYILSRGLAKAGTREPYSDNVD
jgi:hypothetical protein